MNIRKAKFSELHRLLEIYQTARDYMKETGNQHQWKNSYPDKKIVKEDIEKKRCYVMEKDGRIFACFAFMKGLEKSYERDFSCGVEYGIVHRVASDQSERGIVRQIVNFLKDEEILRIDTHKDNIIMQRALENIGFRKLGIVYLHDGSHRILYELKEDV